MSIIEIDSSDSDDDIEDLDWPETSDRSYNAGVAHQWQNNSERLTDQNYGSEMNFQNYNSSHNNENPETSTTSRGWSEESRMNLGNNSRSSMRTETRHMSRENPSNSLQLNGHSESFTIKPPEHSTRSNGGPFLDPSMELQRRKRNNGYEVDRGDMANYRSMTDSKLSPDMQKRILPPSLSHARHKTASGPIDYNDVGKKNTAYEYGTADKRKVSPSLVDDDVVIYKSTGTHRVLPPSLVKGKSVDSPFMVGSNDVGNRSGLTEQRFIEHDERVIYQEALQHLGQPKLEDDLPEGLLSVSLLKHQKIALGWMVQKEKSTHCAGGILADDQGLGKTISMIALIQKQRTQQSTFTSNDSEQPKPEALNLDDDDDDAAVTEADNKNQLDEDGLRKKKVLSIPVRTSGNQRPAAGTLVVCPASILRQWARELDEKVASNAKLSVLIYHGGTRTRDPRELAKYDVVLTTYAIVTNEVPKQTNSADDDGEQKNLDKFHISSEFSSNKRKQTTTSRNKGKKRSKKDSNFDYDSGPLARVRWFRVILDEAQTIKNHRTQVAKACSGLRAKRRWCLSGTPIQNTIDDLYSYFRFLKYEPYSSYSSFCSGIKLPISRSSSDGYKKLQAVLRIVLLRRTKGTLINGEPIIKLPPKSVFLKKVDFSPEERSFYEKLEADSRQEFKKYAAAGTVKQNYASILLMLLRLRQACDHPILVKGHHSASVEIESLDMAKKLPRDVLLNLLHQLEGSLAICRFCNDTPDDAVVTICGHVFCQQCVLDCLTRDDNTCPGIGCKGTLDRKSFFSGPTLQSCISQRIDNTASSSGLTHDEECSVFQTSFVSSKIKAALEILNSLCSPNYFMSAKDCNASDLPATDADGKLDTEVPVKAIVFSQWTTMLDLLEDSLNQSLVQYRRLDGSMSLASRDKAVKEFNSDPEVTVMLMSLKAGNLGLNMVAACHVILLDLWWNPTTEDQAVDRAHRIGQTRPVIVSRLTVKDTVEDRILALQEEKRKLVASAFGEDQPGGNASRLTVDDLRYLFGLG